MEAYIAVKIRVLIHIQLYVVRLIEVKTIAILPVVPPRQQLQQSPDGLSRKS